jgi:hypothetical protein
MAKAKRARKYEVWVRANRDGVISVKAKSAAEAKKLAQEQIDDAWDVEDAAQWFDLDINDVEVCHADPLGGKR